MNAKIDNIIRGITELNNNYRDPNAHTADKLIAMWEIGNFLYELRIKKPHASGWQIQAETKGLIKRPTIFRSYKLRTIWPDKQLMLKEIGKIKQVSHLTDMLPLIDPDQIVRKKLKDEEIKEIFRHACVDGSASFKKFISKFKEKYAHDRLGRPLDKSKHLTGLESIIERFRQLQIFIRNLMKKDNTVAREQFRNTNSREILKAFSNMCISLTTKENVRLYKKIWPNECLTPNEEIKMLYEFFSQILDKKNDIERARLRRLISADALAQMSDMISSIQTEEGVEDFSLRQQLSIGL